MLRKPLILSTLAFLFVPATTGCEDNNRPGPCIRDTDCPTGYRCADGACTLALRQDTGIDSVPDVLQGDTLALDGTESDGGPDGGAPDSDGGLVCRANHDDQIAASEMPVAVGAEIAYQIGTNMTVDLKGTDSGGVKQWELIDSAADDTRVVSKLLPVFEWAKDDFTGATYATLIDSGSGSYGVFIATQDALQLAGVISENEPTFGSGTRLVYDTPVDMLRFPVMPSGTFTTSSTAQGTFDGIAIWVTEEYAVTQLGHGKLKLPQITFDANLVQVEIKQTPYSNPFLTRYRTVFMFIAECYGIVGRIVVDGRVTDLSAVDADERWRQTF